MAKEISLSVCRWAAWAPGLNSWDDWKAWAGGSSVATGPATPDVRFVPPMMRRRLSGLSRMAFRVAEDCLADREQQVAYVFSSRYGEYQRSYQLLADLARDEPLSAAAFSMSVHNTAASLFSIERGDTSQSTSVAGGEATLETAFLDAWCLLQDGAAPAVLVIYHDEVLPELYQAQTTTVGTSAAIAMLLQQSNSTSDDETQLTLSWRARQKGSAADPALADPALQVLKLLIKGDGSLAVDAGRLMWTWSAQSATR